MVNLAPGAIELRKGKEMHTVILLYAIFVVLIIGYYLLNLPISVGDADLWYHMNSGRYTLTQKEIPTTSFFSFVDPARSWVDYYWGFQVAVYSIYEQLGYLGLVIFRCILTLVSILLIFFILFRHQRGLLLAILLSLYPLMLCERNFFVRPHMISYLMIILFIYLLEEKSNKIYFLPFLSIFWVNFHGITYPVLLLITGCYAIGYLKEKILVKKEKYKKILGYVLLLVLAILGVFFSPHGLSLLKVPFVSTEYASLYIGELYKLKLDMILNFSFDFFNPDYNTIINILMLISIIAVLSGVIKRKMQLNHFLLWIGGVFLLTKSSRFITEYLLLTIPSLQYIQLVNDKKQESKLITFPALAGIILLVVFQFRYLTNSEQPKFPFSTKKLPVGVAAFLKHINTGGRIFNDADTGGYLQWEVYPNYTIYMDMEVPFLFTDKDLFVGKYALSSVASFSRFVNRYHPDFLTINWKKSEYANCHKIIQENFSNYRMIFFDDEEVLYINREKYPKIFEKYSFRHIGPLVLSRFSPGEISQNTREQFLSELMRYNQIYNHCAIVNRAASKIFLVDGKYDKSLYHAEMLIDDFPEFPEGYIFKADVLLMKKEYQEALKQYEIALTRMGLTGKTQLCQQLWKCYYGLKLYKKAYNLLKDTGNISSPFFSYKDLYQFSTTALSAGKISEAKMLAELALFKVPDDDPTWKQRILFLLAGFQPARS